MRLNTHMETEVNFKQFVLLADISGEETKYNISRNDEEDKRSV